MHVQLFFGWFDFWVGFYWDRNKRILYFAPLPCLVFKIEGLTAKRDAIKAACRAEYERIRPDCGECGHLREYHRPKEGCIVMRPGLRVCQCTWNGEGVNHAIYDERYLSK